MRRKVEEKERWWEAARLSKGDSSLDDATEGDEELSANERRKLKYSSNYSRWEEWEPSDPVSVEEVRYYNLIYSICM